MKFTAKVAGLRETESALKELKASTARAVTRKALRAGGEILAQEARRLAPVDKGYLAESIGVSGRLTRNQSRGRRKKADQEVFVGPDDRPQAMMQEFGTSHHAANPYMRPAWDRHNRVAMQRTADTMMVEVQKAAKRAQAKTIKVK